MYVDNEFKGDWHRKCQNFGWRLLETGQANLNKDGAARGSPRLAGASGLLKDDLGHWFGAFIHFNGITTLVHAELWAIKDGLEMAQDWGFLCIILEVDMQVIARSLANQNEGLDWNDGIAQDIRSLLGRNWHVVIQYTYGKGNFYVDQLTTYGTPSLQTSTNLVPARWDLIVYYLVILVGPPCLVFLYSNLFI